jgi:hypothetical protein
MHDRKLREVMWHLRGPALGQSPQADQPPQGMEDLDVDQMRSVGISVFAQTLVGLGRDGASEQGPEDRRGIDDDHELRRSRPDRTAATIVFGSTPRIARKPAGERRRPGVVLRPNQLIEHVIG